jgi:hypothetical protein
MEDQEKNYRTFESFLLRNLSNTPKTAGRKAMKQTIRAGQSPMSCHKPKRPSGIGSASIVPGVILGID